MFLAPPPSRRRSRSSPRPGPVPVPPPSRSRPQDPAAVTKPGPATVSTGLGVTSRASPRRGADRCCAAAPRRAWDGAPSPQCSSEKPRTDNRYPRTHNRQPPRRQPTHKQCFRPDSWPLWSGKQSSRQILPYGRGKMGIVTDRRHRK